MRALGVSGGWMFFAHAGDAVAVDLKSGDVTDVFAASELDGHGALAPAGRTAEERRATLLARSTLASQADPLRTFAIPEAVRASVRQAQYWTGVYQRPVELPLIAAGASLVPPLSVQCITQGVLDHDLSPESRARAEALAQGDAVPERLVQQMNAYFSRHSRERVSPAEWLSWGGDSGRVWAAKVAHAATNGNGTVSSILADADRIDYDTLRLLPRAFSVLNGPHTSDCDGNGSCSCGGSKSSAHYPSSRALTYLALGGDAGRDWARRTVRRVEAEALLASGYDADAAVVPEEEETEVPEAESFDGEAPHVFAPVLENPDFCTYCGLGEMDDRHQADAVDYTQADVTPEDAHYFSETVKDPEKCEICGKGTEDTLHKQAALASYYLYKTDVDKKVAETQQYWEGKAGEGEQPEQPVTSAAERFGVDWEEVPVDDLFERATAIDDEMDTLFWSRRGSEEEDPLTYYAAYTGDDQMMVDQIYVSDGGMFYGFDPVRKTWEQTALGNPEQIYELDDDTARAAIRALAVYPNEPVDLREVDPGEALMMADAAHLLDDGMSDRVVIVNASGATFDYAFAEDDGYTPEERSANAKQQVRDAAGRFAKAGSRVAVGGTNRLGVVRKINPDTQQVEVVYDDGEESWVNASDVKVLAEPAGEEPETPRPRLDLSGIEGKPRATGNTPKALLPSMLPPMDAESLNAVVENYPNFIAKERATAAARQAAQDSQDEASKKRYEAEVQKAEEAYRRRLEAVQAKGKKFRDAIDKIYRKLAPKPKPKRGVNMASMLAAGAPITDPAQSDVAPLYLAEVDEANQSAVLELLAMVPASTEGNDAQVLRYTATGWVNDPKVLRQLRSTSPPAVVSLDEAQYTDTLAQITEFYTTPQGKAEAEAEAKEAASPIAAAVLVWGEYGELIAAGVPGVADTPSDISAVRRLKRYWTVGVGGTVKVRWNTPGDMTRCMRNLKKYMKRPGMAEGYCANLHHEMTGVWPGDRRNVGRRGTAGPRLLDTKILTSDEVIAFSGLVAGANALCAGVEAPATVEDVPTELTGAPFRIPILAPVGVKSGDGRHFAPLSLTTRTLPLPLMWQVQTGEGHDDAVIVGRIDSIERAEDGSLVNACGVFDVGPYGQEAERLVRHKFLRGVSVDLDNFEAEARSSEQLAEKDKDDVIRIRADDMTVTNGRVMGATLVAKPAFQEVTIELLEDMMEEETMVADGTYIGTPGTESETEEMVRSALTAAGIPIHPPLEWFADPNLKTETPLTIDDSGRVFGHIATWDTDHIGLPFSTRPPKSRSNYAYFHTGLLRTQEGSDIPVGQLTLAGGHAPLDSDAAMAVKHYDDTASAMCDVHAGEDLYGIWVAGALRPNVTGDQIRAIRASSPSGDWRPINGRLELVAVCQVNVPGFPVTRARVASGHVYALVAAGTSVLSRIRSESAASPMSALLQRVEALEAPQREALDSAREAALARINPVREEHHAQLTAAREAALAKFTKVRSPEAAAARDRVAALLADDGSSLFREIGTEKRKELAKKGHAMPNGGYPITTVGDLKNAIRAYGRAASGEKAAVRRHIKKRARALGKTDLIPESWASLVDPYSDLAGEINDLALRLALVSGATTVPVILHGDETVLDNADCLVAAGGRYPDGTPWNPSNHPRDEKGKFRQVVAELRSDLEGEVGTEGAIEGLKEVELQANQGDTDAAQQAASDVLEMVDKLASNTEDKGLVNTLREGYGNLAEAVANLPLVFGDLNQKYRFSDLPPELKGLIEDLYKRADALLDPEHLQEAGGKLSEFMAGGDVLSQPQISAELSRILRFLI